jgi:DNA-binding transcriptional LysR family regulator
LIKRVLDHNLDCALVGGPVDHPDLMAVEVPIEELVLVSARDADTERLPLILFREGCVYRARAIAWRRAHGHQINEVMELGTLDGILGCVAVGLGCTLVPRWVVTNSRYCEELVVLR